ncbi:hypothetical protein CYMTET_54764 [Cymbomonas tetramitiformis]|uniref:Uncharacterized protein n=1 Tax=Cymbomonas tetramitiformis TaxID=36881 RepID=A0AAE0ENP1_9CHLO|nr:hypothetical protein CYMTET_54764 [Cymbomonas tetramitiformis]
MKKDDRSVSFVDHVRDSTLGYKLAYTGTVTSAFLIAIVSILLGAWILPRWTEYRLRHYNMVISEDSSAFDVWESNHPNISNATEVLPLTPSSSCLGASFFLSARTTSQFRSSRLERT